MMTRIEPPTDKPHYGVTSDGALWGLSKIDATEIYDYETRHTIGWGWIYLGPLRKLKTEQTSITKCGAPMTLDRKQHHSLTSALQRIGDRLSRENVLREIARRRAKDDR